MREKNGSLGNIPPPIRVISQELILSIRREAENFAQQQLNGIANEIIEYLVERQKFTPNLIIVEKGFIRRWAARYWGAIRRAAVSYAKALAQCIGQKKGLGARDVRWILREVGTFFRRHLFGDEAATFLTENTVGVAEILKPQEAGSYFQKTLARYAKVPLLLKVIREDLSKSQELYCGSKNSDLKSRPVKTTPVEMVANPKAFPTMTANQVSDIFQVHRSTVYAWVTEGKLNRAGAGQTPGKRARFLIWTKSVKKLLDENKD